MTNHLPNSVLNAKELVKSLPVGFVYHDSTGKIIFANTSAISILGLNVSEIVGSKSEDTQWMSIREDGSPFPGDEHPVSIVLKTGKEISNVIMGVFNKSLQTYIWINIHASPVFLEQESFPSGAYAIFEDITEIKKNKDFESEVYAKLRQSNLEISQRQNAIDKHAIVAITDKKGTIVYANTRFCTISQYEKEELIGKNHRILNSGYHSKFFFSNMYSAIKNGETWHGEIRNRAKDGSYYWVATTIAPLKNGRGEIEQYLSIGTDITQRVKIEEALRISEAQIRAILDNSFNSIISIHPNKTIQFFNDVAAKQTMAILGKELKINDSMLDVISSEEREVFDQKFEAAIRGETVLSERFFSVKDFRFWFEIQYAPIKNKSLEIIGVLFTARDITEKKNADEEKNKYLIDLENLNQTKDKFFKIIAHDLRNPFLGIIGISEILEGKINTEKREDSAELLKLTELIHISSKSAFALLENLMEWARSQTGDLSFNPVITSINAIIDATIPLVNANAFKKNIQIDRNFGPEKFIFADPAMTNTILRNILSNAIKFTFPNGKITISTKLLEHFVEVSISDSGIGIKADNLDKLFQIDSKFTKLGTENEKGTGLGLILCKEFVKKQGGIIRVESELGKGSTFTFTLPLAK